MKKPVIQIRVSLEDKKKYVDKAWETRTNLSALIRDLAEAGWMLKYGNPAASRKK